MWSCEAFRRKKAVRKSRFHRCFKGIDRMDKKSVDRAYSIPKQARYQLRYTRMIPFCMIPQERPKSNCLLPAGTAAGALRKEAG